MLTGDRQDAQELVQEVFLRAWRSWSRLALLDGQEAWLRRVLYNLAIGRWRKLSLRVRRQSLASSPGVSQAAGAERLDVMQALVSLPPRQREALVLVAVLDLTTEQAARQMNAAEGTVRVWVSRARSKLERLLYPDHESTPGGEASERL